MSDLDPTRISDVVDSLANVFDEDRSGTVGKSKNLSERKEIFLYIVFRHK